MYVFIIGEARGHVEPERASSRYNASKELLYVAVLSGPSYSKMSLLNLC